MAYTKQTWANGPTGGTPLSAARLQHIEDGLGQLDAASAAAVFLDSRGYIPHAQVVGEVYDARRSGVVVGDTGDNTAQLADAVQTVSAAGGGILQLPPGITRGVLRLRSGVYAKGASRLASTLKSPAGVNTPVVALFDARQEQVGLSDLTIHGNRADPARTGSTTAHGVWIQNDAATNGPFASGINNPYHFFSNLFIRDVYLDGFRAEGDVFGGGLDVLGVTTYFCDRYGFYSTTPDSQWERCVAGQSGQQGFRLSDSNSRHVNCKSWFSGRLDANNGDGFYLVDALRVDLIACEAQDNQRHGFSLLRAALCTIAEADADSNGTGVTGAGFSLNDSRQNRITGKAFDRVPNQPPLQGTSATQEYLVQLAGGTNATQNVIDLIGGFTPAAGADVQGSDTDIAANDIRINRTVAFSGRNSYRNVTAAPRLVETSTMLTTGEETFPRENLTTSAAGVSGSLYLTYFAARSVVPSTASRMITGGTAGAGITLAVMGLFTVDLTTGDLTLVASTANDTTLFSAANTTYTRNWTAAYTKVLGQVYAHAVLVAATTMPAIGGYTVLSAAEYALAPRMTGLLTSQTGLPVTIPAASLTASNRRFYAAL